MSNKYQWEPWYAWRPVRINGKWYFRETVYRRYQICTTKGYWIYGDTFDVLSN